jgi:hypothetical protein
MLKFREQSPAKSRKYWQAAACSGTPREQPQNAKVRGVRRKVLLDLFPG